MTRRLLMTMALLGRGRMAHLAGGRFWMGSRAEDLAREFPEAGAGLKAMLSAETPRHEVSVAPFWMDRYEVTNAEFARFVLAKPEWRPGRRGSDYLASWRGLNYPRGESDFPVVGVTWAAAEAYARWAGKRLPSEAEWEFAARGGDAFARYPWGNQEPSAALANYGGGGPGRTVPVGRYPSNPYGIYDLAGNVWEWCQDPWRHSYEGEPSLERSVIRGGSYAGAAMNLRVTARDSHPASHAAPFIGFRCAK